MAETGKTAAKRLEDAVKNGKSLDVKTYDAITSLTGNIEESSIEYLEKNKMAMNNLYQFITDLLDENDSTLGSGKVFSVLVEGNKDFYREIQDSELAQKMVKNMNIDEIRTVLTSFFQTISAIDYEKMNKKTEEKIKNIIEIAQLVNGDS